jgi:hypothetical protein
VLSSLNLLSIAGCNVYVHQVSLHELTSDKTSLCRLGPDGSGLLCAEYLLDALSPCILVAIVRFPYYDLVAAFRDLPRESCAMVDSGLPYAKGHDEFSMKVVASWTFSPGVAYKPLRSGRKTY